MAKTLKSTKPTRPYTVRYQIRSSEGELTTTHMVVVTAATPVQAKLAVSKLKVTGIEPEEPEEPEDDDEDIEDTFDENPTELTPGTIELPGEE